MKILILYSMFFIKCLFANGQVFNNLLENNIWDREVIKKNKIEKVRLERKIEKNEKPSEENHIIEIHFNASGYKTFMSSYTEKNGVILFVLDTIYFSNSHQSDYDCIFSNVDTAIKYSCNEFGKLEYLKQYNNIQTYEYDQSKKLKKEYSMSDKGEGSFLKLYSKYDYGTGNHLKKILNYEQKNKAPCDDQYSKVKLEDSCYSLKNYFKINYTLSGNINFVRKFYLTNNGFEELLASYYFTYNQNDLVSKIKMFDKDLNIPYFIKAVYTQFKRR